MIYYHDKVFLRIMITGIAVFAELLLLNLSYLPINCFILMAAYVQIRQIG